jgi:chromosome segregation ATPase
MSAIQAVATVEALEAEKLELLQAQSAMGQLMNEFFSSVSAAEDAATMLSALDSLAAMIDRNLDSLVPSLSSALTQVDAARVGKAALGADLHTLQLELEERKKSAAGALEECARLTAQLKMLGDEKDEFKKKVELKVQIS